MKISAFIQPQEYMEEQYTIRGYKSQENVSLSPKCLPDLWEGDSGIQTQPSGRSAPNEALNKTMKAKNQDGSFNQLWDTWG